MIPIKHQNLAGVHVLYMPYPVVSSHIIIYGDNIICVIRAYIVMQNMLHTYSHMRHFPVGRFATAVLVDDPGVC